MAEGLEPRRHLDLEGAYNIRDIGGYAASDGRRTRWQRLLRADSLHRLAPASQRALIEYGVRTVIDLRTTDELQEAPDIFATSAEVGYLHHNMLGDTWLDGTSGSTTPSDGVLVGATELLELYTLSDKR